MEKVNVSKTATPNGGTYINGYRYAFICLDGTLLYFVAPLRVSRKVGTKMIYTNVQKPTEEQLNAAGYYKVVNVQEDGTDYYNEVTNCIYHYIGAPYVEEPQPEPEDGEETIEP